VIHQLSDTGLYFIDDELHRYILRQPEGRVLFSVRTPAPPSMPCTEAVR